MNFGAQLIHVFSKHDGQSHIFISSFLPTVKYPYREDTESKRAEAVLQTVRTVPHPFCPARNVSTKSMRFKEYAIRRNISWQNVTDVTSGEFSSFVVRPKHREFQVCDQLELVIQARNGLNQTKSYGGDYFRARILTKNQTFAASSSTDGEVIDHDNGTYSALFTLKWDGFVNIEVTLVHPSEAVHVLQQVQSEGFVEAGYLGGFRTENSSKVEATLCDVALPSKYGPLCNFTDDNSGSPWFCVKPENVSCEHWFGHRARRSLMKETRFNDKNSILPFKKAYVNISGDVETVKVESREGVSSVVHSEVLARLPSCHPTALGSQAEVAGFYWEKYWYSGSCKIRQFSKEEAMSCLQNKSVRLLGDSTIRQLFEYYAKTFKLKTSTSRKFPSWFIGPMKGVKSKYDIDISFRFHGYPISRGSNWEITSCIEYVVNVLDSIRDDENVTVIVLAVGAHFTKHLPPIFEARIHSIVDAIHRLRERSPQTIVLFKSLNTREHKLVEHYLTNSDWIMRDLNWRLTRIISEENHVGFLDAWDMTNAQFAAPYVHPLPPHIENISNQVLSYICPEA
ncbi:NXPE family member 3-like [Diadema setosum]|uniref:NXPE family member 3-like n=1 Tax=Diadema setosum TaxID=31175 RepID=UPI003B3A3F11